MKKVIVKKFESFLYLQAQTDLMLILNDIWSMF